MVTIPIDNYKHILKLLERLHQESLVEPDTDFDNGYACASHYAYEELSKALESLPKLNKVCALCKKDVTNGV
jgi:hypothetical protein